MTEKQWNPPSTMPTGVKVRIKTFTGRERVAITYNKELNKDGNKRCQSRDNPMNSDVVAVGWLPLEGEEV